MDDAPSSTGARLRARLGHWWLRRQGWRVVGQPPTPRRFVLVGAPHTSNWDLPYMLAFGWIYGVRIHWMGKHTLFRPPLGWVMQRLGGIAIDRRSPHGIVEQMAQRFADADELVLAIPPEGTRSRVEYWKSGFYEIAKAAGVPIVLGFLDYGAKEGGIGPSLRPSGDVVRDMDFVRAFYRGKAGKHPEAWAEPRLRAEDRVSH
ncbi:MAG: lysophospholipid acyltransferase family protein [Myxococcales bacterium]|nr:lysophospholipid acyltransferase family protein [Myxococcales bacterium]